MNVLTPFNNNKQKISNQILIAENVIIGTIPENYYNLEGINKQDTVKIIE